MKILSMTATFGKLQNQTLTLKPGLNVIHAPNEWGKSTWCAFLVTMLYGLPPRERNTKDALSDKEHYTPWSGAPMSGSMNIEWNGRAITIQRRSKGRTPMGEFYAFETDTGLEVKELTADNCGEVLLGVERSVFTRSAFLRFSDLPVEQDEALRSRLNALVTTGDESNASQRFGQKLRELKNKCSGRAGLLPQLRVQKTALENKLQQQNDLSEQILRLQQRQKDLDIWISQLENHKASLEYEAAKDNSQRIAQAIAARDEAKLHLGNMEADCARLSDRDEAQTELDELTALRREWDSLQMEQQMLPPAPIVPETPSAFSGLTPEDALAAAMADKATSENTALPHSIVPKVVLCVGAAALVAGIAVALAVHTIAGIGVCGLAAAAIIAGIALLSKEQKAAKAIQLRLTAIADRYGTDDPETWVVMATQFAQAWSDYRHEMAEYTALRGDIDHRSEKMTATLAAKGNLADRTSALQDIIGQWDALDDARRNYQQLENHAATLQSMSPTVTAPTAPDTMTHSEAETNRLLADAAYERRQLDLRLGQFQGQTDNLGNSEQLRRDLEALNQRINRLEQTNAALDIAQETLTDASARLQRRFAPRITQQAKELFAQLTAGRYDRLTLGEDLRMQASAQGEDTLRSAQWRSDGTIDQLYLALRLAVVRELSPAAPMILDDALVRFDDTRLKAALNILSDEAENRQILLFTCQERETRLLEGASL